VEEEHQDSEVRDKVQMADQVQVVFKVVTEHNQVMKVDLVLQKEMQDQLTNQKTLQEQEADMLMADNQCQVVEVVMVVQ
tara:strand:+ start:200 stop:436 length:237 start_codon:yes stop_codon:yes gene_type:complete